MATSNVAVLVGSLRRESLNRKLARNLIALAPSATREFPGKFMNASESRIDHNARG